MNKLSNQVKMMLFTVLLGAFAGLVIWCFLKGVSLCSALIWEKLPSDGAYSFLPVLICALGGCLVGMLHKRYGDYPDKLDTVMEKIRTERYYSYRHIIPLLICAFVPLICYASVGPEAGLTGIIAALCYWVGDNVTYAGEHIAEYSRIGETVALAQIFHSPLFGIFAVEESGDDPEVHGLSRGYKLLFYTLSTAASFLVVEVLNSVFGAAMGAFPAFSEMRGGFADGCLLLLYIPVGLLSYVLFELMEKLTKNAGGRIPVIIRETLCGAVIGIAALLFPMAMSSGEEQMEALMGTFTEYAPVALIGICLLKLLMTAFCINFGMKGGHFFPLIFACTCMGFALSGLLFSDPSAHAAFAAAAVTATMLGAQLKKPLAAALLLLLCFPAKGLLLILLCAAIGAKAAELIHI